MSTATNTLNSLEEKGTITRQKRPSKSKGNISTMYFVKPLVIASLQRGVLHIAEKGSPHSGEGSPYSGDELVHRTNPFNYKDQRH